MPVVSSKASRRVAALVAAAATVLPAAACGGGSGSAGAPIAGGGNAAFTAYVNCLKQNGVTITLPSGRPRLRPSDAGQPSGIPGPRPSGGAGRPDGLPGGGLFRKPAGVDDATWQKAQAACASLRPSFNPGNRGGANQAYLNCLRDHGVTPGPGMSSAGPATVKAMAICRVLRPAPRPTPSA